MIVIDHYSDGSFVPIYYERKNLFTYLSQQVRSLGQISTVDALDGFEVQWGMSHELQVPAAVKVSRFVRNRLKVIAGDDGSLVVIPCVVLQVRIEDNKNKIKKTDHTILWKDIITYYASLEKRLLTLMEKSEECRI
tara:strand:+ start:10881 stop:11288 length:408 start_codon:yes stop_codon:yes gene_type:complete